MRVFQIYNFLIPLKTPFYTWPQFVECFLQDQGLSYHRFYYYFESLLLENYRNPCQWAVSENPQLGAVQIQKHSSGFSRAILTNLPNGNGCSQAELLNLLPKLSRRYGISTTHLIYQDVSFFNRVIPALENPSEPNLGRFDGSCITLTRDNVFHRWSGLQLQIDIGSEDMILDASCYRDAIQALLPECECMAYISPCFTLEEEAFYAQQKQRVQPYLEQARQFLKENLPQVSNAQGTAGRVSAANVLKKLCQKYGFRYLGYCYHVYRMKKRTALGHYITIEVENGRSGDECNITVDFKGLGFDLRLMTFCWVPDSKMDISFIYDQIFQLLCQAEAHVLQPIGALFPETPNWFSLN